jgi:NAD(P)H dehydrogenase (quinone)
MRVLIVYAHHEPKSFNAALKDHAVARLEAAGHSVVVSDLYAQGFEASAGPEDFTGDRADPAHFKYGPEGGRAWETGTLSDDIVAEQAKLAQADALILQFPMWWFSLPAVLKGWIDRVFTVGFAYGGPAWYDNGKFRGKRAMLSLTTGSPAPSFSGRGLHGDMERILWPIHNGVLRFCGFDVLPPFVGYGPTLVGDEGRAAMLDAHGRHIDGLFTDPPLFFHPLADFEARVLKPDVVPATSGQHD